MKRKFWPNTLLTGWATTIMLAATGLAPIGIANVSAQITTVDPNEALDADLKQPVPSTDQAPTPQSADGYIPPSATYDNNPTIDPNSDLATSEAPVVSVDAVGSGTVTTPADTANTGIPANLPTSGDQTYKKDDLIGAAEGVFGKGAQGVAEMIQGLLAKQGEPNGYIVGREASGAFVVGLRYGSGRLYHKVEGERDVYWTGPSVGLDTGGNASRSFVLVYNLHDTQELYKRFPAGEGSAYMVGGLTASYMRRGDVVLIPIRMGVGMRLGVNAGYMKFTEKRKWLPF